MSGSGFRIGWVAGGSHAEQIQRLQLIGIIHQFPMRGGVEWIISTRRYDAHLRHVASSLPNVNSKHSKPLCAISPASKIHHNDSGYFLWLELLGNDAD